MIPRQYWLGIVKLKNVFRSNLNHFKTFILPNILLTGWLTDLPTNRLNQLWNQVKSTGSCFVQVIKVRPALKIIRVWPRLYHVIREIKKTLYGSAIIDSTATFVFVSHTHFLQWYSLAASAQRATHVCTYVCNNCHLQFAQSHTHHLLLQDSRVLPLQCAREYYPAKHMQQTYSLHEATFTFTSHIPVCASLQIVHPLIHQDICS